MSRYRGDYWLEKKGPGPWLIKERFSDTTYTAGYDEEKAAKLMSRLNNTYRPSVKQDRDNEISVCWNNHHRSAPCEYVKEI